MGEFDSYIGAGSFFAQFVVLTHCLVLECSSNSLLTAANNGCDNAVNVEHKLGI